MSRKDGTFPPYTKLLLDPKKVPNNYTENGSRRCIVCDKCWPNMNLFSPTPCCNANAGINPEGPDMTWDVAIKGLLAARFERWYARWDEGTSDEQLVHDSSIGPYSVKGKSADGITNLVNQELVSVECQN